eukprot:3846689-Rhodomonas_salina.1
MSLTLWYYSTDRLLYYNADPKVLRREPKGVLTVLMMYGAMVLTLWCYGATVPIGLCTPHAMLLRT